MKKIAIQNRYIPDPQHQPQTTMRSTKARPAFVQFSKWICRATGHPLAFTFALALIAVWGLSGPLLGFSDSWQLVINTTTTIMTFLMVFLIQSSQNRDSEAAHLKLDELIRSVKGAHLALLDLEELDERELDRIRAGYAKLARQAREDLARGVSDTDSREV